jgi:hypothetical protein
MPSGPTTLVNARGGRANLHFVTQGQGVTSRFTFALDTYVFFRAPGMGP